MYLSLSKGSCVIISGFLFYFDDDVYVVVVDIDIDIDDDDDDDLINRLNAC